MVSQFNAPVACRAPVCYSIESLEQHSNTACHIMCYSFASKEMSFLHAEKSHAAIFDTEI